jgi:hypothetical protein
MTVSSISSPPSRGIARNWELPSPYFMSTQRTSSRTRVTTGAFEASQ